MDWFAKHRMTRRIIIFAITFVFLKITLLTSVAILDKGVILDTNAVAVYGIFAGIMTLIVKFILQGTKDQADSD